MRRGAVRDAVEGALFALAIAPFFVLPADWTIRAFGAVARRLLPISPFAARARRNLADVWPTLEPAESRRIVAGMADNFGRVLAEYIRMPDVAARRDRRRATGVEHVLAAAEAGRGLVLVSAHFGNWEAARLAARDAGVETGILYRAFNNPWFDKLSMPRIRAAGDPVLHKGRDGARGLLGHLRRGGAIMVLLDQRASNGEALPFLGRPALTATAVAALCARTGAALIPARAARAADGLSFDVTFEPPIPHGTASAMTAAVNARLSDWVERQPDQWFWLHRRWKGGETAAAQAVAPPSR